MKMIKPRMNKGVAVAALMSVCVAAWGFNANAALTNLALKKTVTVSSVENNTMPGSNIVDGDTLTRWGSAFSDSQWFYIDFGAVTTFDSLAIWWEHSNAVIYNIQTANTPTSTDQGWTTIVSITNEMEVIADDQTKSVHHRIKLATPSTARYLKFRCIQRHYQWGYSMHEVQVFNTQEVVAPAKRVNLALRKTATADSYNGAMTPAMAFDSIKSQGSRWENLWGSQPAGQEGNCWIYVNLGTKYLVDSVAVYWEHSGSKDYVVQAWTSAAATPTANDADWTTLIRDTTLYYQNPPVDMCLSFLKLPPTATQYVRIHSYKRMWTWGVSIMEFEVYGNAITSVKPAMQKMIGASGLTLTKTSNGVSIKANGVNESKMSTDIFAPNGKMIRHLSCSDASFWNLKDAFGNTVTNGTYMVRVTVAGKTYQDKVLISR